MGINKYNSEGYYDPTAYEALTAMEQEEKATKVFRPLVYICSPYSGNVESNIKSARRYSRFAVETGYIPFTPHLLYPQFLDDDNPAERSLGYSLAMYLCQNARRSGCLAAISPPA